MTKKYIRDQTTIAIKIFKDITASQSEKKDQGKKDRAQNVYIIAVNRVVNKMRARGWY